ncbi:MAG: hypothetical protein A2Y03_01800 [Omnitrophica WOR_2 bacterium GWF2_38_59]|nr:MAG: hypothetical protein A2Y06_05510 [Omnitrophica WOR_2 bacterium GWA2_37_7]OGX22777.1 MAG: hypothetical protein A2Y03_01800 [Omnitrophica WOR_2 bacterium GWF2_38_59]OGX50917.1 MAG: hypothetical protein A2243_06500 [Omnitrophica WOR_2 bacterium RIFOXYA2_FULL_38_17]OGX55312.1 MAG: hypothetical protein A2447_00775 [Omnitrophica WOR_2 bacterium RIFOXYC2_FULL_38_12]OGX60563.1 MAG: hypothetical protein A2306_03125 [Omnitrophica WOR_2 bacterium RIFOXYB2_FULL_38_16]
MVGPVIKEIAKEYSGKLVVGKLNVDEAQKVASKYGVMSIPTLSIFKSGKRIDTMVGAMPKEAIVAKIKPHIS